jgi:hypothetical protein
VFPPGCSVDPLLSWVRFVPFSSTSCVVTLPSITPLRLVTKHRSNYLVRGSASHWVPFQLNCQPAVLYL